MSFAQKVVVIGIAILVVGSLLFGLFALAGSIIKSSYSSVTLVDASNKSVSQQFGETKGLLEYARESLKDTEYLYYKPALELMIMSINQSGALESSSNQNTGVFLDNIDAVNVNILCTVTVTPLFVTDKYIIYTYNDAHRVGLICKLDHVQVQQVTLSAGSYIVNYNDNYVAVLVR